jgi:hypothetical protein
MLMISRAIACGFLLFAPYVYGQDDPLERRVSDFDSKGVGLTETLLKFSHQQHLPIAVEYLDRASMDQPVEICLRNVTIGRALDSILHNGNGYRWRLRNGIIEVSNRHASQHAERQLNRVIPVFKISKGETVKMTSTMLWWNLQIALDPSLKGFAGHVMGGSSTVKPATLHNRTVREILSYIVLNSQAEGWIVAGPPECLGYTPYCGLWYFVEGEPFGTSYPVVLRKIRENL